MKENKKKISELPFDEELEIFGEHKTREQVKAEEKKQRAEERKALKEELLRQRKEAKENGTPTRRKDILIISAVLVGIVLLCVVALFGSFKEGEWEMDRARGRFQKADASPVMSGTGPMLDVSEAYFTNNGHLCIKMIISNGTDKVVRIDSLDIQAYNNDTGEMIGGGKATLTEELTIEVAGTTTYTFHIAPEHLKVDEKYVLPELVYFGYDIEFTSIEVE